MSEIDPMIILFVVFGLMMFQIIYTLSQINKRMKSDLNTVVQRCDNLTKLVSELQEENAKMESRQQLVEK